MFLGEAEIALIAPISFCCFLFFASLLFFFKHIHISFPLRILPYIRPTPRSLLRGFTLPLPSTRPSSTANPLPSLSSLSLCVCLPLLAHKLVSPLQARPFFHSVTSSFQSPFRNHLKHGHGQSMGKLSRGHCLAHVQGIDQQGSREGHCRSRQFPGSAASTQQVPPPSLRMDNLPPLHRHDILLHHLGLTFMSLC